MQIHCVGVGTRMPGWVRQGYQEYARRLTGPCRLRLVEIPLGSRRSSGDASRAKAQEGERMLAALPKSVLVIALEVQGRPWSTDELAERLAAWLAGGRDVALLIGGPDGLAAVCLERAEHRWSLSPLTLPHGLVRIVVAEQLYRAWSMLHHHPYHRGE